MSFLRNLVSDLVEKRLWPVALLLVGALVAVPFLLGGGAHVRRRPGRDAPRPRPPTTTTTTATTIRVSEDTNLASMAPTGTKHNPFRQPKAEQAATTDDSAATDAVGVRGDADQRRHRLHGRHDDAVDDHAVPDDDRRRRTPRRPRRPTRTRRRSAST